MNTFFHFENKVKQGSIFSYFIPRFSSHHKFIKYVGRRGCLNMIKWSRYNGFEHDMNIIFQEAYRIGQIEVLEWVYNNSSFVTKENGYEGLSYAHVNSVLWFLNREDGFEETYFSILYIIRYERLDILEIILHMIRDHPQRENICIQAITLGLPRVISWLIHKEFIIKEEAYIWSFCKGNFDVINSLNRNFMLDYAQINNRLEELGY